MSKATSKRIWERLVAAAGLARPGLPAAPRAEQSPTPPRRPTGPLATTPPGFGRTPVLLARMFFCIIIVVNLTAGGIVWLSKVQAIHQSAMDDLPTHLARVEALLARPDVLDSGILEQLTTELTATERDLHSLQDALPVNAELGIGSSGKTAHALQLGIDMAQSGESLITAARVLLPSLLGLSDSMLKGPKGALQAGHTQLTIADIETAQQNIAQAKQAWQQALSDWSAFSGGIPDLSSPSLKVIVRAMALMSHTFTVALAATSAMLDWSTTLLGLRSPSNILLVEENPDVLRPTGGAITHYAVLTFANGMLSSDIRLHSTTTLDCQQRVCPVSALPPAATWIPISRAPVQMRDANLDPDLTVSGWSIYNHFEQAGGPQIAGIIVATQNMFADILGAIGPVRIQGLPGSFTAGNVVERMRALRTDEARLSQAGTIASTTPAGDIDVRLFNAILIALKSVTPEQRSALGHTLVQALLTKDLQLFTSNGRVRDSLMGMNIAGQVRAPSGDSLEIVDTNASGAPVNPFITETASDSVTLNAHGGAQHELSLTYHYAAPETSPPSPPYADVVRVIVPNAALGQTISGPCTPLQMTQAYHRVLACEFTVTPNTTVTLHFSWQVPQVWGVTGRAPHSYTLLLQRQPGAKLDVRLSISPPAGQSLSDVVAPWRIAGGQLAFAVAPLLADTTLQAFFREL